MQAARKKAKKQTGRISGIEVVSPLARTVPRSTILPPAHPVETITIKRLENVMNWEADPADIHRRPTYRP
jgi:hypothetical protein